MHAFLGRNAPIPYASWRSWQGRDMARFGHHRIEASRQECGDGPDAASFYR
jgi:hypothetical protein